MTPAERFAEDSVLRRVARARPVIPEELYPTGERAAAIVERALASPRQTPPTRAGGHPPLRPQGAWRRRRPALLGTCALAAAAACAAIVLVLTGAFAGSSTPQALADVIHVEVKASPLAPNEQKAFDSTRLGRTIQRQLQLTQENVRTGTAAQNRTAIAVLTANRRACARATRAVAAVPVPAKGLLHVVQRDWIRGNRLQGLGNEQLITALHAFDAGHRVLGKRDENTALNTLDADDALTGWSEEALYAPPPGPKPKLPPLSLSARRILR